MKAICGFKVTKTPARMAFQPLESQEAGHPYKQDVDLAGQENESHRRKRQPGYSLPSFLNAKHRSLKENKVYAGP